MSESVETKKTKLGDFGAIEYVVDSSVAIITLNRPDSLNAFNGQMMEELLTAMDMADGDDDVRAVVFTGAGRAFCAGADLARGGNTFHRPDEVTESAPVRRDGGGRVSLRIFDMSKPTIGAINGPAVGVGITMTLPMDVRFAVADAKIGFVFASRGIAPEACSSWFLPRIVGISKAAEWCYTGRVFDGAEAAEAGLVRLVPDGNVVGEALALARQIADNAAPVSVAVTRRMLWRGLTFNHPMEAHRADSRAVQYLGATADAREGVQSFLEKRSPEWSLRPSANTPDIMPWQTEPEFE